ncbi:MAG: hypothetical protein OCD01_15160 [Fibrobacterales bacterium]
MPLNKTVIKLRKSTLVLSVLIFISILFRIVEVFNSPITPPESPTEKHTYINAYICTNIVQQQPVDIRKSFFEFERRIFFYTKSDTTIPVSNHTWYNGNTIVKTHTCPHTATLCISSIGRNELLKGNWSVDFFTQRTLLHSRQFTVSKKPLL